MIEIHPVLGLPEVKNGDDIAALLMAALGAQGLEPRAGDIVVVTQKIVSKAEGRIARLNEASPSARARELAAITGKDARLVEIVLRQSDSIVRAAPNVLIARHKLGFVLANGGVDRSNLGDADADSVLLLPENPDRSAEQIGEALSARYGAPVALVISDSFGRPWRLGVVNVAIGAWGLPALMDRRGEKDRDGRALEVTQVAFADLAASAAGLAMGEAAEGVPAALVRGCAFAAESTKAVDLVRPLEQDLFR